MVFKKYMNRREHQKRLRERDREQLKIDLNLEFNDDHYAPATPEFWTAWRGAPKHAVVREFAPAQYLPAQLGMPGNKPVWVVFVNRTAKAIFDERLQAEKSADVRERLKNTDGKTQGLGWQALRTNGGMFLDDRHKTYRSQRAPVVAWLNYNHGRYAVNVVHNAFKLTRPIPAAITDLGDAVEWVYQNSAWSR